MKQIDVILRGLTYRADVDDEDYDFLNQFNWTASVRRSVTYATTNVETERGFKCVAMHRMVVGDAKEIWKIPDGIIPLEHLLDNGKTIYLFPERYRRFRQITVDHIDGNGLNKYTDKSQTPYLPRSSQ